MCALEAEHIEHGLLRREDSTTTNGTNFDRRHRHSDEEILAVVGSAEDITVSHENEMLREKMSLTAPSRSCSWSSQHSEPDLAQ